MGSACGFLMMSGSWKSKGEGLRGARAAPSMTPRSLKVVLYSALQQPAFRLPAHAQGWAKGGGVERWEGGGRRAWKCACHVLATARGGHL